VLLTRDYLTGNRRRDQAATKALHELLPQESFLFNLQASGAANRTYSLVRVWNEAGFDRNGKAIREHHLGEKPDAVVASIVALARELVR
jgi:hypothetical protein